MADPEDPVQDPAPGIVVFQEEMDPSIERGDGDFPVGTEIRHRAGTFQVSMQDGQDKTEGIGTERDQDVREHGMGMPTGSAEEPGNRDGNFYPFSGRDGDQFPLIRPDL